MIKPEKMSKSDADAILLRARKDFAFSEEQEKDNRKEALDDLEFLNLKQWPEQQVEKRRRKNRPTLTVDRLNQFCRQVVNDIRQNRPSIRVQGVDGNSDPDTAKIFSGIIKHIEYNSNADVAYDTAAEAAVRASFGYYRVITDYCDDESFDQEVLIKRIANPFTVYFDPECQEADYSDAKYAFVTEEMSKKEFGKRYPKAEAVSVNLESVGDMGGWINKESVRIAEYWVVEEKETELSDGESTRKVRKRTVKCYKISGTDILEEYIWPGKWIPIIPVLGEELNIEGKRILRSLIRTGKDPQKLFNFWKSTEAEYLQKAPKVPVVGAKGQFKGQERKWSTAHTEDWGFLEYEPVSIEGTLAPPPQIQPFPSAPIGIINAGQASEEDIQKSIGMGNSNLGQSDNATSGRAILARQREGDTATFHFTDNLVRSIRHCGRILIDLIPKIYDTPRIIRILGEDGNEDMTPINQPFIEQGGKKIPVGYDSPEMMEGIAKIFDLKVGKYDVVVSAGPSYTTKRDETREVILQMAQANPKLLDLGGDILLRTFDIAGMEELAERWKMTLPPGMAKSKDGEEEGPQIPPEVMAEMQGMQEQLMAAGEQFQALQGELSQLQQERQAKQSELAVKMQEAQIKSQTEMAKVQADLQMAQWDRETRFMELEAQKPAPIDVEAEDMKTQQVMEQLAQILAQSAGQQNEALASLAQSIQQSNQITAALLQQVAAPKRVQITRGQNGQIEGALAVPVMEE